MNFKKTICQLSFSSALLSLLALPVKADTEFNSDDERFKFNLYGSLRMQAESVRPDNEQTMSAYRGLRDAYSRIGANMSYAINDEVSLFGQIEVPFDAVNLRFTDPYDQGGLGRDNRENLRIARAGIKSPYGTAVVGQQWMPYYNAITLPVDNFSTFYSGFATYTTFRIKETVSYMSPKMNGFSFGGSYTTAAGNDRSPSRIDDRRIQAVASYQMKDTILAIGMDDRGDPQGDTDRIYGITLSHQIDNWHFAVKYETTENTVPNSFYGDGADGYTFYTGYDHGKNTYKLLVADMESYGEAVIHLGIDHRYSEDLTLFAEFYQEQETAALTGKHEGVAGFDSGISGGKVFAAGFRYNFEL